KEQLKKYKVLWLYMKNNIQQNIIILIQCISYFPSNINLIFQWKYINPDTISDHSLFALHNFELQKLSDALRNTGINSYVPPFLLFIDPNDNFLGNNDHYSHLYDLFFSDYTSSPLIYQYSSLY